MRAATTETDDDVHGGGHRRLKRSSDLLPVRRSPDSHHSWVLLNGVGARRDGYPGDRTTSAMSLTSKGEEVSVSFELVEPPGISVLTVDCPRASPTLRRKSESYGSVIAAHRDVVLLAISSNEENTSPPNRGVVDLFVYQASLDPSLRRRPSLLLLPSAGGSHRTKGMGIMSCTGNGDDDSTSFVVATLEISSETNDGRLFRSGSGQWEAFKNLHVRGANGGRDANGCRDLDYWWTDAVFPYGSRYMIWVDYYRGMILMDLSSSSSSSSEKKPPPRLRYVPLPVNRVGDPENYEWGGRGSPEACRRVCVTRHGVKFVSVDTRHWSDFGVGGHHVLTWSQRFRITTWSLREHDYTWRRDATMHEQEFWDALDGGDRRSPFPHVQPEYPVVDMDNPDVVVFRLQKRDYGDENKPRWMIEVDLWKKVLRAATAYTKKESDGLSGDDAEAINYARMVPDFDPPIPSELPRYLDGGQACKKRKQ